MLEEQRAVHEQHEDGDQAAERSREPPAEREDVEEGDAAEERVPDTRIPSSLCGSSPGAIGAATIQNLSGGFSRKPGRSNGLQDGIEPVAAREHAVDGVGVNGFVVLEVRAAQADEQRQRERRHDDRQPERPAQSFTHVTSDQIRGTFTFSIETGSSADCVRNAGRSRSALKPM